jgi:hypothetical protein
VLTIQYSFKEDIRSYDIQGIPIDPFSLTWLRVVALNRVTLPPEAVDLIQPTTG